MSKLLLELGLLTQLDRAALALYCQAWQRYCEAEETIGRLGQVVPKLRTLEGEAGTDEKELIEYVVNPAVGLAERAAKQVTRLLAEFGLTPSSRTRLGSPEKKNDEEDPFADLFRRAQGKKAGEN